MYIVNKDSIREEEVRDAKNATIRWLIDEKVAENFAMRYFVIRRGGSSPLHSHDWEHEMFVVRGEGYVFDGNKKTKVREGDAIFIPPNQTHQMLNENSETLEVLCLIPIKREI
jgi:quercetin dioxygenase-like cupin family protein